MFRSPFRSVRCCFQTKSEGSNLFGKENSLYPVLQTYEEGGIMEVKVVFSTYHWVSELTFRTFSDVHFVLVETYDHSRNQLSF